jgi:hypothetical protein
MSWYMHIREYTSNYYYIEGIIYVRECRCSYRHAYYLYMRVYIYSCRVYICMSANILLLYMLRLSMYLYMEYSVYMDIRGYVVLITRCNYGLIIK